MLMTNYPLKKIYPFSRGRSVSCEENLGKTNLYEGLMEELLDESK
jgi:hypothetical protein